MKTPQEIIALMDRLQEVYPRPRCELNYVNAYTLLVAVVLSAQTTDKGVNKATESLFTQVDTPQKMLDFGLDRLRMAIKTIGLYNTKAQHIMALSQTLVDSYGGIVPEDRQALEKLAGVGRKTANVVLNVWFGHPTLAVDTHVFRVAHRLGMSNGKTPLEVEKDLSKVLPEKHLKDANHRLVLFGRYICKAQKPQCDVCPLLTLCGAGGPRAMPDQVAG